MAKVKKSTVWKNICLTFSLLLALTAIAMLFFPMVAKTDGSLIYKGYEIVGPYMIENFEVLGTVTVTPIWNFSFGNFMAYLLAVLGVICCVAAIAYKKQGLVLAVLTMLLFIGAGLLFVQQAGNLEPYTKAYRASLERGDFIGSLVGMTDAEIEQKINQKVNEYIVSIRGQYEVAWGAIVAAVCCFVAGASALMSKIMWQIYHKD